MRRTLPILVYLLVVGLLLPVGALAHVSVVAPPAEHVPASREVSSAVLSAAPPIAAPFALALGLLAGGLLALAMRRQSRRALVLAVVVLVALFAMEGGIHSVHHLGDATAGKCPVAAAASHLILCLDGGPPVVTPWLTPAGVVAEEALAAPVTAGPGLDLARAPPAPIA